MFCAVVKTSKSIFILLISLFWVRFFPIVSVMEDSEEMPMFITLRYVCGSLFYTLHCPNCSSSDSTAGFVLQS